MILLRQLRPVSGDKLPHITWCPTGPLAFLPLHAAGNYRKRGATDKLFSLAVSSYTPTLEALLRPRMVLPAVSEGARGEPPAILAVCQAADTSIPRTRLEVDGIHALFPKSTSVLVDGTASAVLDKMASHKWVHLASHGIQDETNPTESAFLLHESKLTLAKLMSTSLPDAELAVLSACWTATGDKKLPEEAVHLAAGMLSVGYKSVVGSMWSISDEHAPILMKRFYEVMREQVQTGGEPEPAYALHEATKHLRAHLGQQDFVEWVPFVHFGM